MKYTWDPNSRIYKSGITQDFNYSDGEEVERRLYKIVSGVKDRSTLSPELADKITDWPSEYHLSRSRHCILRPLGIRPEQRVLELGCGCGAITRYLGEIGAQVVSVEGSIHRAKIAAERCKDLKNVSIYATDLATFELDGKFDWVLLIGVLEYAPVFGSGDNPVKNYLLQAMKYVAPEGKLVVAIENKLGLKYFNGCAEDHLGIPYYGIQGLYSNRSPQTFGRMELSQHLSEAGLKNIQYLFPFPDYKLPRFIVPETALTDSEFNVTDLLARSHARDYSGKVYRSFDDALAISQLSHNGLLPELSNSFLAVCSKENQDNNLPFLAMAFSVERIPKFASQTVIQRQNGKIIVSKKPVSADKQRSCTLPNGTVLLNTFDSGPYIQGRQVLWRLLSARAKGGTSKEIIGALKPWFQYLMQHASLRINTGTKKTNIKNHIGAYTVPGIFLDCTPFNLMETSSGLVPIDTEWVAQSDIDLGWVVTRSVLYSITTGISTKNPDYSIFQIIQGLCTEWKLDVTKKDVQLWHEYEADLQYGVSGIRHPILSIDDHPSGLLTHHSVIESLEEKLNNQSKHFIQIQKEFDEKSEWANKLNSQVLDLRKALANLQKEFDNRSAWAQNLNSQVQPLQEALVKFQKEFDDRSAWAIKLNSQVLEQQNTIIGLQKEFDDRSAWAQNLNSQVLEQQNIISRFQQDLDDKSKLATQLETQITIQDKIIQDQRNQIDRLTTLYQKTTRIKRRLLLLTAPLDWLIGLLITLTEIAGRFVRKITPRKPPSFPPAATTECSIIIASWEGKDLLSESLPACIKAVGKNGGNHEIIVVDNGSTDGTEEFIKTNFPSVRVLRLPKNLFFSRGNNLGVKAATRDIIVLLNNDMVVDSEFLNDLLPPFKDPEIFSVASQVFFQDKSKRREETGKTRGYFAKGELTLSHDEILPGDIIAGLIPVLYSGGGAAAFDRRKYLWLDGLDELYSPFYYEDTDLSYRAWKAGWKCCLAANSHVIHKHRATAIPHFGRDFVDNTVMRNSYLFLWKNLSNLSFLWSHFFKSAALRVRQASIPNNGTAFIFRAYLRAMFRLPLTLFCRFAAQRSFLNSDEEVFDLASRPISDQLCGSVINFHNDPSDISLGTGWHEIESDNLGKYRWMDLNSSAYLKTPASDKMCFTIEGYIPSLELFITDDLQLTISIGSFRKAFHLEEGILNIRWPLPNTNPGKVERIHLSLNHNIRKTMDKRCLTMIVRQLSLKLFD